MHGDVVVAHAFEHLHHRHVGQAAAGSRAQEDEVVAVLGRQHAQQLDGAIRSGTRCSWPPFMRPAGTFQSFRIEIELGPLRADDLASACNGEDANSSARAATPSRFRSSAMKGGRSAVGSAA